MGRGPMLHVAWIMPKQVLQCVYFQWGICIFNLYAYYIYSNLFSGILIDMYVIYIIYIYRDLMYYNICACLTDQSPYAICT